MALASTCLFADLDELKPWLKIPASTTQFDAILEDLANAVTEEIEAKTGRVFVQRTVTERVHGDGTARAQLTYFPVAVPITSFTVEGEDLTDEEYVLDAQRGTVVLLDGYLFPRSLGALAVEYTAGYPRATVPARVKRLAREMVKIWFDEWQVGAIATSSVSVGASTMVLKPGWPYHVREALDDLKREANP